MLKTYHAFYSRQMHRHTTAHVYRTPDGREVITTQVCATRDHGLAWPDVVYQGEVLAVRGWVREVPRLPEE
jgi:hypothetical protein